MSQPTVEPRVVDLEGLNMLAASVVANAKKGLVVWLSGDLGSGKTAFVHQAVRAAGVDGASSPTYTLVHEYQSPHGPIFHVDCYRLNDPAEAIDLDFPDMLKRGAMVFVEWPERAGAEAPSPDMHFVFAHVGDASRRSVERVR